ncbi:MAG: hypothetical protein NTV80_11040 [Verrucomicrobia bacterium]|nr:hypothetical protein [Verrucomicrobiota bacterium]
MVRERHALGLKVVRTWSEGSAHLVWMADAGALVSVGLEGVMDTVPLHLLLMCARYLLRMNRHKLATIIPVVAGCPALSWKGCS